MKLTPTLEETLEELKANTLLYKMQNVYDTPHRFAPAAFANRKPVDDMINGRYTFGFPNRQSLNKLVMLGYAEYMDKEKTIIKYIDKDAIDAELKRKAEAYDRMQDLNPVARFEDKLQIDPLDLKEEQLMNLDKDNLKLLYDTLLHMVYGAFSEIEDLEKDYRSLQDHIENVRRSI